MARVKIPFSVETKVEISSTKVVAPVVGATVTAKNRDTSATVSIYAAENGSSVIASPVTDENGNIPGWLEEGSYSIKVSGGSPAIAPVEMAWDAVRGDGVSIVANGVITPSMLASSMTALLVPTGVVFPYVGSALPEGYLWAAGGAFSRTTYANLYSKIGTIFGSGNGTTTFNVPDGRGRTFYGADNFGGMGAAGRLISQTFSSDGLHNENILAGVGGQGSHVLSTSELAAHSHGATSTDSGHLHNLGAENFGGTVTAEASGTIISSQTGGGADYTLATTTTGAFSVGYYAKTGFADISTTIGSIGSSLAHNNMSPYQVSYWIIKY